MEHLIHRFCLFIVCASAFALGGCWGKGDLRNPSKVGKPGEAPVASDASIKAPSTQITAQCLGKRIPVIMYHDIIRERTKDSVWFDCTAEEFEKQMQEIELNGYTPISLDLLYQHLTNGADLPFKPIVLTFDDNYQGYYDHALPILRKYGWPSAVFVHTGFVGSTTGTHPKMTWDTLQELCRDPLITIASHTVTHPDLEGMMEYDQRKEIEESKAQLEGHLKIKIDYFAYPEGKFDETTLSLSKDAGYKMAFTIANGPAEMSPNILQVNRYVHTRLDKAFEECEQSLRSAPGVFEQTLTEQPVELLQNDSKRVTVLAVAGGKLSTITSATRESVLDFIKRSPGAVAGINGTFFPLAAIAATDNRLLGPALSPDRPEFFPDDDKTRWPRLANRPLVLWNDSQLMIVPFVPEWMNDEQNVRGILSGVSNVFLAGAWLVHDGDPLPEDDLRAFATKDVMDYRRRAAFGVLKDGRVFGAATKGSLSSEQFAQELADMDVKEAVLLDSGFSTSLVYDGHILASGHSTASQPSRPVPHAILFSGEVTPASQTLATQMDIGPSSSSETPRRRRRRN